MRGAGFSHVDDPFITDFPYTQLIAVYPRANHSKAIISILRIMYIMLN